MSNGVVGICWRCGSRQQISKPGWWQCPADGCAARNLTIVHRVDGLEGGRVETVRDERLKWSAETPKVPGYYWLKSRTRHAQVFTVESIVVLVDADLRVWLPGNAVERSAVLDFAGAEWSGPIPEPEE